MYLQIILKFLFNFVLEYFIVIFFRLILIFIEKAYIHFAALDYFVNVCSYCANINNSLKCYYIYDHLTIIRYLLHQVTIKKGIKLL